MATSYFLKDFGCRPLTSSTGLSCASSDPFYANLNLAANGCPQIPTYCPKVDEGCKMSENLYNYNDFDCDGRFQKPVACFREKPSPLYNYVKTDYDKHKSDKGCSNNSTLSLHIAAYENSVENVVNSFEEIDKHAFKKPLYDARKFRDPYPDFPRFLGGFVASPENMNFKMSQKIMNLDESPPNLFMQSFKDSAHFHSLNKHFTSNFGNALFSLSSDEYLFIDSGSICLISDEMLNRESNIAGFLDYLGRGDYAVIQPKTCSQFSGTNNKSQAKNSSTEGSGQKPASNVNQKPEKFASKQGQLQSGSGSSSSEDEGSPENFDTALEKSSSSSSGEDDKVGDPKRRKKKGKARNYDRYHLRIQRKASAKADGCSKSAINDENNSNTKNGENQQHQQYDIDKNDKQLSAAVSYMKHSVNWTKKKFDQLRDLLKDTVYSTFADQMCSKFLEDLENGSCKIQSSELMKILLHFIPKRMQPKIDVTSSIITASSELSTPLKTTELSLNDTQNSSTLNSTQVSPTNKTQNSFDSTQTVRTKDDPPRNVLPTHSTPIIPGNKHPRVLVHRRHHHRSPTNATLSNVPSLPSDKDASIMLDTAGSPTTRSIRDAILAERTCVLIAPDTDKCLDIIGSEYDRLYAVMDRCNNFIGFRESIQLFYDQYLKLIKEEKDKHKQDIYLLEKSMAKLQLELEGKIPVKEYDVDEVLSIGSRTLRDKLDSEIYLSLDKLKALNMALEVMNVTEFPDVNGITFWDYGIRKNFGFHEEHQIKAHEELAEYFNTYELLLKKIVNIVYYVNQRRELLGRKLKKLIESSDIPDGRALIFNLIMSKFNSINLSFDPKADMIFNNDENEEESLKWENLSAVKAEVYDIFEMSEKVKKFLTEISSPDRLNVVSEAVALKFNSLVVEDFTGGDHQ